MPFNPLEDGAVKSNEAFMPETNVSTELSQKKRQEQKDRKLRRSRFKKKKHGRPV